MFRRDKAMVKDWLQKGPDYYVPIQRKLLLDAADMLKKGGMLLYSTCTFSVKENEENKYPVHSIRIVPVRFL